jgi:hypothetical protein
VWCVGVGVVLMVIADGVIEQWLADEKPHFVPDPSRADGGPADLLPNVKKAFNAKQLCMCLPFPRWLVDLDLAS